MIPSGEGLGLLALANYVVEKTKNNLNQGEATVCSDNKDVLNNTENDVKKESHNTSKAGATLGGIRRVTKKVNTSIKFECAKPNPKSNTTLSVNSLDMF